MICQYLRVPLGINGPATMAFRMVVAIEFDCNLALLRMMLLSAE